MTDVAPPSPETALAYHRLARAWPDARWWRPLLGLAIAGALYTAAMFAVILVFVLVEVLATGSTAAAMSLDQYDPVAFATTMGSIVLMLPAALIGFRLAGCRPLGLLSSVAGRLRWRWMLTCTGPAAVVLLVALGAGVALQAAQGPIELGRVGSPLLFLLIVVLVPVQAAAEEFAFRGVLLQTIGAWLRSPVWAIVLPAPLFMMGHLYDLPGLLSVGVFAIAAGWITWRTGGLEAAIALHVVNNLAALAFGAAGLADLNATEVDGASAVVSALVPVVSVLWIDRLFRRRADLSARRPAQAASSA